MSSIHIILELIEFEAAKLYSEKKPSLNRETIRVPFNKITCNFADIFVRAQEIMYEKRASLNIINNVHHNTAVQYPLINTE